MSAEEKKEATSMDILESPDSPVPLIPITISYYGQEFDIELEPNSTVRELKEKLDSLAEVSVENQRLLYKQILPDDMKVCEINITGRRRKIMLTGPQKVSLRHFEFIYLIFRIKVLRDIKILKVYIIRQCIKLVYMAYAATFS